VEADTVVEIETARGPERLHVLEDGAGEAACLVWHGLDSVNRFYHWSYLRKYGRLIRVGLPGHGPVGQVSWQHCKGWSPDHLADVAVGVCRRYSHGSPLTLVGHSTGALLALSAAIRAPELVGRLLLINPLIWSPASKAVRVVARTQLWRWIAMLALAPAIRRKRGSIDSFLQGLRPIIGDRRGFYDNPNTRAYTEAGHENYRTTSLSAIVALAKVCVTCDLRDVITKAKVKVPTLIVHGEADTLSPIAQSEWLAENLSGAKLVKLPGVGHLSYAEREHDFSALATEWLDAQPSQTVSGGA
jgi:pimeloyl-ACP methyl ester carboxylesterase